MTDKQLQRIVDTWRDKLLAPLGLSHWRIEAKIVDVPFGDEQYADSDAAIGCADDYDHAFLHVKRSAAERLTERGLNEVIVHELLHAVWRDLDQAVDSIQDRLSPTEWNMWADRVRHEKEGVVDRLALAIVSLRTDFE